MNHREPIVQERILPAPPERVFAAWGDPESLRGWMCPADDIARASAEVDFRVGGAFRIVMHGREGDYGHTGEYLEIDAPHRLVFTWISDFVPQAEAKTRVTVSLEAAEIELMEQRERVASLRRELPPGPVVDTDYVFDAIDLSNAGVVPHLRQRLNFAVVVPAI